jgi:hypothetical protein
MEADELFICLANFIQAPLVVASGAIGFAQYLTYIIELTPIQEKIISGSLVILVFLLLYRKIETIGKISVVMGSIVYLQFFGSL